MLRNLIFLPVVMIAAGCATQYHNPEITDPEMAARQQAMDETYCTRMAGGAYVPPPVRLYEQPAYQVSGTVTTYGAGGYSTSQYSGVARPYGGGGFASGFAQGSAAAAPLAAAIAQQRVIDTCMRGFGWIKGAPPKK